MSIQPQSAALLDQVALSAITAGFGLMVGVVLGIVIGVHLVSLRRSTSSTSTSSTSSTPAAAPAMVREVVREYVREVPAGPALRLQAVPLNRLHHLDRSTIEGRALTGPEATQ